MSSLDCTTQQAGCWKTLIFQQVALPLKFALRSRRAQPVSRAPPPRLPGSGCSLKSTERMGLALSELGVPGGPGTIDPP